MFSSAANAKKGSASKNKPKRPQKKPGADKSKIPKSSTTYDAARDIERFRCPKCNIFFVTRHGLGVHMGTRAHKSKK